MQERGGAARSVCKASVETHRGGCSLRAGEMDIAIAALMQVVLLPICQIFSPRLTRTTGCCLCTPLVFCSTVQIGSSSVLLLCRQSWAALHDR